MAIDIQILFGLPLATGNDLESVRAKRGDEKYFPDENLSMVTEEKLLKLKEFADANRDPKLYELYDAVSHYVHVAHNNKEYVLWKYDADKEGLVLVLKKNLNGILYYG